MAFIPLKDFLSIWHFKLIGLIGPRAVSERVNPTEFVVYPNQLNIQSMGFEIIMPPGFIFKVTNHCNDKPWRIPTQFLNHNTDKESFCLPLISSQKAVIAKGEIIAHIQLLPILDAYEIIKGNLCHNKNVIKTYLTRSLFQMPTLCTCQTQTKTFRIVKTKTLDPPRQ